MDTLGGANAETIKRAGRKIAHLFDVPLEKLAFDVTPSGDAAVTGIYAEGFNGNERKLAATLTQAFGKEVQGMYTPENRLKGLIFKGSNVQQATDAIARLDTEATEKLKTEITSLKAASVSQGRKI